MGLIQKRTIVAVCFLFLIGFIMFPRISDNNLTLIKKHHSNVIFTEESLESKEFEEKTVLWIEGTTGNEDNLYVFLVKDNQVIFSHIFSKAYLSENVPLEWGRSSNANDSIIYGIYAPEYIDKISIEGIDLNKINYATYANVKLFFSVEYNDIDPVKITGYKNGNIVYKTYPD